MDRCNVHGWSVRVNVSRETVSTESAVSTTVESRCVGILPRWKWHSIQSPLKDRCVGALLRWAWHSIQSPLNYFNHLTLCMPEYSSFEPLLSSKATVQNNQQLRCTHATQTLQLAARKGTLSPSYFQLSYLYYFWKLTKVRSYPNGQMQRIPWLKCENQCKQGAMFGIQTFYLFQV